MTIKNLKKRLDCLLVDKKIVETRSKASELIKKGKVKVEGKTIVKPGKLVNPASRIEIEKDKFFYVSRAGEKLAYALEKFNINVANKICLDVGSSTGGFVDCLIKNGAKMVYAVDVGQNQLHSSLRKNKKVRVFENTDIRNFSLPKNKKVNLITVDISFISVKLILPILKKFLLPNAEIIVLIKPQFEVGRKYLNKKGVVKDFSVVEKIIKEIIQTATQAGFVPQGLITSPIKGKEGNQEFLLYLKWTS